MKVTLVIDNPKSWINKYKDILIDRLKNLSCKVSFCRDYKKIKNGDIAIFLSCEKIVPKEFLKKSKHNLIIHASNLPKGKGWSPLTWQILQGKNKIPITLFEAIEKPDSGPIYYKDYIILEGHELIDEIREKLFQKILELLIKFIKNYPDNKPKPQKGKETFFPRRTPKDSELNIHKSIKEQFNLLRVVDNERYPAFFYYKGHKYILKIYKST